MSKFLADFNKAEKIELSILVGNILSWSIVIANYLVN